MEEPQRDFMGLGELVVGLGQPGHPEGHALGGPSPWQPGPARSKEEGPVPSLRSPSWKAPGAMRCQESCVGRIHSLERLSCILGWGVNILTKVPVSLLQEAHRGPHSQPFSPPGSLPGSHSSSFTSRLQAPPVCVTHLPFLPAWWLFIRTCACVCLCVCKMCVLPDCSVSALDAAPRCLPFLGLLRGAGVGRRTGPDREIRRLCPGSRLLQRAM